jgi:hypothetical protein
MTPELLIKFCPYCGSTDIHEVERLVGPEVEVATAWCLGCDEWCEINRKVDEGENDEKSDSDVGSTGV